jgi:hypothetical protein
LKKAAGSSIKETVQETPYDNISQKEELIKILNNQKNEKEKLCKLQNLDSHFLVIQIQRSEKTVLDTKVNFLSIIKILARHRQYIQKTRN